MRMNNWIYQKLHPDVGQRNVIDREKWLQSVLREIPAGSRILDAGAGTQRYRRFCTHLDYVSQDFAQYDGSGDGTALQKGTFDYGELDIICDITAIPEPDNTFDAIMCIEVLEHIPRPNHALKELIRLLKPGGILILTAPFCSLTHYAPYHFYTGFNRYWYEENLPAYGMEILEITRNGNFFEYLAQEVDRIQPTAGKYTQNVLRFIELLAMVIVLNLLARLSKYDLGSSELLCYGYQVRARKISGIQQI